MWIYEIALVLSRKKPGSNTKCRCPTSNAGRDFKHINEAKTENFLSKNDAKNCFGYNITETQLNSKGMVLSAN